MIVGILAVLFVASVFAAILFLLGYWIWRLVPRRSPLGRGEEMEDWVARELLVRLPVYYIIFGDLIIPSISKDIPSTQIDHIIVSQYGIFCLETKSHQGSIYGNYRSTHWKQYLGRGRFDFYNPIKQNKHHVQSLEYLLRARLKAPIHSYIVFPSALHVTVGGRRTDMTLGATIDKILRHRRMVYTPEDVTAIAKGLALVTEYSSPELKAVHVKSVQSYIAARHNGART